MLLKTLDELLEKIDQEGKAYFAWAYRVKNACYIQSSKLTYFYFKTIDWSYIRQKLESMDEEGRIRAINAYARDIDEIKTWNVPEDEKWYRIGLVITFAPDRLMHYIDTWCEGRWKDEYDSPELAVAGAQASTSKGL